MLKSNRWKDVSAGMLVGVIGCLILIACGSSPTSAVNPTTASTSFGTTAAVQNQAAGNAPTVAQAQTSTGVVAQTNLQVPLTPTGSLNVDIRNVIKATRPAVVLITAETVKGGDIGSFFGRDQVVQRGVGTGSIINANGTIITNYHVVEGANRVTVTLPDGRKYPGQVIGTEGQTSDLAVIKINPAGNDNLPVIQLGDSSKMEVGEAVVAIGNALGLPGGPSVTAGIVSAFGRSVQEPNGAQLAELIQTDAAINPGNSGGPLLNLRGEQIGINTAAPVDQSSGNAAPGIGLALNINSIKPLVQGFLGGQGQPVADKPFMGVLPQDNTPGLASKYQLPIDTGVLLGRVDPGSPAERAGWKAGDIVVKFDGKDIRNSADLAAALVGKRPNDVVQVELVARDGNRRQAPITLGKATK